MKSGFFLSLTLLLMIAGCNPQPVNMKGLACAQDTLHAVYYWRTDLHLDATERHFLKQYDIQKIFCRYFDVVMHGDEPMPNATLTFTDTIPADVEVVPTVYITEDCMHQWHEGLAQRLVERLRQMNETHGLGPLSEIQIDCDYTAKSHPLYYRFLKQVRQLVPHLSTTIRLHQLSMAAPPVDYGVLMVYNTGSLDRWPERNPILDLRDVQPYLHRLADYPLPLATAYPVFSWLRIVHGVHVTHTVEADEILRVKEAVEQARPDLRRAIITYHLDSENILRYPPAVYQNIFMH